MKVSLDGWDVKLPDAGATRDMLGLLRQLLGDGERASFTAITGLLKRHADGSSVAGRKLSETIARLAILFTSFAHLVDSALATAGT